MQGGYNYSELKNMTLRQFHKAIEAMDKQNRIITGDLYTDEVTAEGELYLLGKIFGGIFG